MVVELLNNIWLVFLDTAFWLLIGLLAAGAIKSFIAENTMQRWVGGNGIGAILRAALFGAPLPLCSCGVLPVLAACLACFEPPPYLLKFLADLFSAPFFVHDDCSQKYCKLTPQNH